MYLQSSNETYLLLTDSLTYLIAGFIDSCLVSGNNIVIVTTDKETKKAIENDIGTPVFYCPIKPQKNAGLFYKENMPGSLEDMSIDGFPIWKGLSIDRLRFWSIETGFLDEFISKLNYTKSVVDMNPMANISTVFDSIKNIVVLKNRTFRTPEILSFMEQQSDNIVEFVTDTNDDIPLLAKYDKPIHIWAVEEKFKPPTADDREGQLCYYDKQYIWQFNELIERFGFIQPVSYDSRSIETFPLCHPGFKGKILPPNTKKRPLELVMFAYDENIIKQIDPEKVLIFDPYGVNRARELAVGDEKVRFISHG